MPLKGGAELRARIAAVAACGPDIQAEWANVASREMRSSAPVRTGELKRSIHPEAQLGKAGVWGDYWGIFIDRGTKAHDIVVKNKRVLANKASKTVFGRKVHRRRKSAQPFIRAAAQNALRDSSMRDQIIQAWNRKRARGRFMKLDL